MSAPHPRRQPSRALAASLVAIAAACGVSQNPAQAQTPLLRGAQTEAEEIATPIDRPTRAPVRTGVRRPTVAATGRPVHVATSPDRLRRRPDPPDARFPPVAEPTIAPTLTPAQRARLEARARELRAQDPYAPLGIEVGALRLFPAIEAAAGYDTNPRRVAGGKGSSVYRTEGSLRLESDWSAHALTSDLRGSYSWFPNVDGANRPEGEARIGLRLDASRDLRFNVETRGRLETQQPGSVDAPTDVRDRPLVATYGASAQAEQTLGRWTARLRGSIDRTSYADATLNNGTTLSQSDRDLTQYELRGRVGYEATPGLRPYVEARLDTRRYDEVTALTDANGVETGSALDRSSAGASLFLGTTFEFTRTLTGEAQAGYGRRAYDDARLRDLRGPLFEGSLVWTASPLTTVTLRGAATLGETTLVGASGVRDNRIGLELAHALRRNLVATGTIGFARADYKGAGLTEDTLTAGARLDWRLTRSVVVRASFTHERFKTSGVGRDYTANAFLLGLRLQR